VQASLHLRGSLDAYDVCILGRSAAECETHSTLFLHIIIIIIKLPN
jgi:hypothetical protein